jgi:hypothetical protein
MNIVLTRGWEAQGRGFSEGGMKIRFVAKMIATLTAKMTAAVLCIAGLAAAETPDEKEVVEVAQRLFDAMAAKDADAARAMALPEARHISLRANGTVTVSTHEQFAARLASAKGQWMERMWNPKVLVHGGVAEVWAEYDFHLDGKFSHCGVDSFHMVKTGAGWKMSEISYTVETAGCAPPPASK